MQGGGELDWIAAAENVHIQRGWRGAQKMVVQCRDLDPFPGQFPHDRAHLIGREDEIAHDQPIREESINVPRAALGIGIG